MRYRLYGEWEKDDERNPMLLSARQTAKVCKNMHFICNKCFNWVAFGASCLLIIGACGHIAAGHQKDSKEARKRKFEAAGSDGCKTSSCESNDCTSNYCSSGIVFDAVIIYF